MHLGNAWTALLAWLSARSQGGAMVLRMEDLDPERSKPHFAAAILEDMAWLGLDWDEGPDKGGPYGPYTQDARRGLYQQWLDVLDSRGLLYPCYCTRSELRSMAQAPHAGEAEPVYGGACLNLDAAARAAKLGQGRQPAMRLSLSGTPIVARGIRANSQDRTPGHEAAPFDRQGMGAEAQAAHEQCITFQDLILGPQSQNLVAECGDFALRRSDGVHAYQLAVVADDAAQRISEVVRGADLLESTARQIHLFRLFGWSEPRYAHVPLLVDQDGRRLSKRRQDVDLGQLRQRGVSPQAIVGYLAWRAGVLDAARPVAPAELIDGFSFQALPVGPVVIEELWLEEHF